MGRETETLLLINQMIDHHQSHAVACGIRLPFETPTVTPTVSALYLSHLLSGQQEGNNSMWQAILFLIPRVRSISPAVNVRRCGGNHSAFLTGTWYWLREDKVAVCTHTSAFAHVPVVTDTSSDLISNSSFQSQLKAKCFSKNWSRILNFNVPSRVSRRWYTFDLQELLH